jgi:hypothetical protein
MFVDEKRQADLSNTWISASKNFGLTKRMLLSDAAGASASTRLWRERFAPMQAARLIYFGLPIPLFAQIPREFNDPLVTFLGADIIYWSDRIVRNKIEVLASNVCCKCNKQA